MAAQPSVQPPIVLANLALIPAGETYYGCVDNTTGAIRVVSKATVCNPTDHKIQWSQVGPQPLPARTFGTTANPVLSTIVANQTCNICKRYINPPLTLILCESSFELAFAPRLV